MSIIITKRALKNTPKNVPNPQAKTDIKDKAQKGTDNSMEFSFESMGPINDRTIIISDKKSPSNYSSYQFIKSNEYVVD